MSNPENPLARFNTYSYHHVLVVTDGMKTVDNIVNDPSAFDRPSNNINERYEPIEFAGGKYIILIDSRTDVQFNINGVMWETILAPRRNAEGVRYSNTIEAEGTMEIHEPFGIEFFRRLAIATRDLERAPSGLVFVLKTIFVGHTAGGNQEIISNVKPFAFNAVDIKAAMDEGGATYKLDFVATTNGFGMLPKISMITNGLGLTVEKNITLGQALKRLERQINEKYDEYYEMLAQSIGAEDDVPNESDSTNFSQGSTFLQSRYNKVRYKIEFDPVYNNAPYLIGGQAIASDMVNGDEINIKAGPKSSIMSTIDMVASMCEQMGKDANGENPDGRTFTTKITSTLSPNPSNGEQEIIYRLNRFETALQRANDETEPQPGEFIEFNYIYSGKNVDILDFDIKMDYGLSFFHTAALAKNTADSQTENIEGAELRTMQGAGNSEGTADINAGTANTPTERKEPLYLGLNVTKASNRAKANPAYDVSFDALIARQAALENVNATIKIIGNPQLLSETTPFYEDVMTGAGAPVTPESTGASDWFHVPSLIKLNIQYPTTNELNSTRDFWYRGFYNLYRIQNKFDHGQFTQEIEMFSIPGKGESDLNTEGASVEANEAIVNSNSQITRPRTVEQEEDQQPLTDLPSRQSSDGLLPLFAIDDPNAQDFAEAQILYKSTVNAHPLTLDQPILDIYWVIVAVWELLAPNIRPVITSTVRNTLVAGTNRPSLHNVSRAIDLRGNNLTNVQGITIRNELRRRLRGMGFTVLWETFSFQARNHIHIQFDGRDIIPLPDDENAIDDTRVIIASNNGGL